MCGRFQPHMSALFNHNIQEHVRENVINDKFLSYSLRMMLFIKPTNRTKRVQQKRDSGCGLLPRSLTNWHKFKGSTHSFIRLHIGKNYINVFLRRWKWPKRPNQRLHHKMERHIEISFWNISSIGRSNMERSSEAQEAPAMARDNDLYLPTTRVVMWGLHTQQIFIARSIVTPLQCH